MHNKVRLSAAAVVFAAALLGVLLTADSADATYCYIDCMDDCFYTWVIMDELCETQQCISEALEWWQQCQTDCLGQPICQ